MGSKRLLRILCRKLGRLHRDSYWALLARLRPDKPVIARLRSGERIRIYPRDVIGRHIFGKGFFEEAECAFCLRALRPGQIFYDVGANIGQFSLIAAGRVGEQGAVHAFEPGPSVLPELRYNLSLNGLEERVRVQPVGLSDQAGSGQLSRFAPGGSVYGSLAHTSWGDFEPVGTDEVPLMTLDAYFEAGNPLPDFLKLDVEGAERSVLRGATHLLESDHPSLILVEVCDRNTAAFDYPARAITDLLQEHGYHLQALDERGELVAFEANDALSLNVVAKRGIKA